MKPSDLTSFLVSMIAAREPVLIVGSPGIGKSDIVATATRNAGADLMVSHPVVSDPTDAKGLPWIAEGGESATFLPFGDLARAIHATSPLVWFLDDLGQAPPSVQAAYMQLLLNRAVNGHALPDCVTFLAATNRRTDRAGVSGVLEPVKGRFGIVGLEPDLDDFCVWAFGAGMPAELIAFLRLRPDLLSDFQPTADLEQSPTPRGWARVGRLMALDVDRAIQGEVFAGAVGPAAAAEFVSFLAVYAQLPSIDGILIDPETGDVPTRPATLYAVATALGMRATPANFGRVARYAERLVEAGSGEFAALLIRDVVRRDASITQTAPFVRLASGDLGQLIGGTVS